MLKLPIQARNRDGNDWEITSDSIEGNFSLAVNTLGGFGNNAVATRQRVINMEKDFNLSIKWRSPDPNSRGPDVFLIRPKGSDLRDYTWDRIFASNRIGLSYGGDAISRKGSPFRSFADFNGKRFNQRSHSAGTVHSTKIVKRGSNATLYFNGRKKIVTKVNNSGQFRLLLGSSATWGSASRIVFDSIKYTEVDTPVNIEQGLNETVFVGSGKKLLQAIALNTTVIPASNYENVRERVEKSDLKPIGKGSDTRISKIDSLNRAFGVSKKRYYASSSERGVYIAALAAKDNASLVFNKGRADRTFSNYSTRELQELFIERFKPHHVVVADLDSGKGRLAALMAVRQKIMPVDIDRGRKPAKNHTLWKRWNKKKVAENLENRIEETFDRIGVNRNTVRHGKYVSILSGPRKLYKDPVEKGIIDDPSDGKFFFSDIQYGNLDSDPLIEAGVGRYPRELGKASKLYLRSLEREKGKRALVVSEYLHSHWPEVLATFGGGMWNGKMAAYSLEKQGYRTEQLVEQRSRPVALIFDLLGTPTVLDATVNSIKLSKKQIASKLGSTVADMVKNFAYLYRGARYGEELLQIYLEHDWKGWKPAKQELYLPDSPSPEEVGKSVRSFLPTRYPELSAENLRERMRNADIIYYQGIGNSSGWTLPNKDSGFLKNRYTGEKRYTPRHIPALENPVVWDNSDKAGIRNAKMKEEMIDQGSAAFLGYSTVNYAPYSSITAKKFFKYGETVGKSMKNALNSLKTSHLIYNPRNPLKTGIRKKMERSLTLTGNPETLKDPVAKTSLTHSQKCIGKRCELTVTVDPKYQLKKSETGKKLTFDAENYLMQEFRPITPLYQFITDFKGNTTFIEQHENFSRIDNVNFHYLPVFSHSGKFLNKTFRSDKFPHKTYEANISDQLVYVQAAMQKSGSDARVLEKSKFTIGYRSSYTLDLVSDGKNLSASVYSHEPVNATLYIETGNFTRTFEVSLARGTNNLYLGRLPYGIRNVESKLFGEKVLASASETLKFTRPLEYNLVSEKIRKGVENSIRIRLHNPNDFRLSKNLELDTGHKIAAGLLEDRKKTIKLEAGESKTVTWRVIGLEKGESRVSILNANKSLEVVSSKQSVLAKSSDSLKQMYSGHGSKAKVRNAEEFTLKSSAGKLKVSNGRNKTYSLKTDDFSVRKTVSSNKVIIEGKNSNGRAIEIKGKTRQVIEKGMKIEKVRGYGKILRREVSKISPLFVNRIKIPES